MDTYRASESSNNSSKRKRTLFQEKQKGGFICATCRVWVLSSHTIYFEFDNSTESSENIGTIIEELRADLVAVTEARASEVGCLGDKLAAAQAELAQAATFHAAAEASIESLGAETKQRQADSVRQAAVFAMEMAVMQETHKEKLRTAYEVAEEAEGLRAELVAVTEARASEVGCLGGKLAAAQAELAQAAIFHAAAEEFFESWDAQAQQRQADSVKQVATAEEQRLEQESARDAAVAAATATAAAVSATAVAAGPTEKGHCNGQR